MSTASTRLTTACWRMNDPTVTQMRRSTSARWPPALGPATLCTHGRNFGPSLTNRNVRMRTSTNVITPDAIEPTPVSTPVAMVETLSWMRVVTCWTSAVSWLSARLSGGPEIHVRTLWTPVTTLATICGRLPATAVPTRVISTPITRIPTTTTTPEASAGAKRWRRRNAAGGQNTVASTMASSVGNTTVHSSADEEAQQPDACGDEQQAGAPPGGPRQADTDHAATSGAGHAA